MSRCEAPHAAVCYSIIAYRTAARYAHTFKNLPSPNHRLSVRKDQHHDQTRNQPHGRRGRAQAQAGGALEYYDFFIYATAASLIFSKIFFPPGDPTAALLASFATFGVAYIARPFGAVLFGHLGDKIGRKSTLVLTLVMMGGATFLIGMLSTRP